MDQQKPRGLHRVKFSVSGDDDSKAFKKPLPGILVPARDQRSPTTTAFPPYTEIDDSQDVADTPRDLRSPVESDEEDDDMLRRNKMFSALSAQDRAQRLASLLGSHSAPGSRRNSSESTGLAPTASPPITPIPSNPRNPYPVRIDDIPLVEINGESHRPYSVYDSDEDAEKELINERETVKHETQQEEGARRQRAVSNAEAHKIVRAMTNKYRLTNPNTSGTDGLKSGQITPIEEQDPDAYAPRPTEYKAGILSSLLKLYDHQQQQAENAGRAPPSGHRPRTSWHSRKNTNDSSSGLLPGTPGSSPGTSGTSTPRRPKWYEQRTPNMSTSSVAGLLEASSMMAAPGTAAGASKKPPRRPAMPGRNHSGGLVTNALQKMTKPRLEDEIRITVHIAEVLARQRYLLKLCRALMMYGAPTHRLEEYMRMSARVLQIDGQFLYLPGCMIVSFDDATTHTAEVKLVRASHGVDLGRLKDIHTIYKEVVHDTVGVEEATQNLDQILKAKPKFSAWLRVIVYGFASATVGPFAFGARPIDMPLCFLLGCILGILQLIVAPASELYSNVFEISASVVTSFLARAFGSIYRADGSPYFCFSAMAQSAIALILPGYIILCGALELQSRSLVAGSVRMVYAIIYALMLGFGILVGSLIYGLMDGNAQSSTTCSSEGWEWWLNNDPLSHFPFVPFFTLCLIIINQGKWKQVPVMMVISFAGYQVNFWSSKRFSSNVQVANALGAFAIGVLGNLYSRLRHGVAAAALLPAIFVQVPSGLAASGSLVSGVTSADQITSSNGTSSSSSSSSYGSSNVWAIGYGMVQVAIGISVGLFLSALVIYPLGKRRSGLFSF
ncbi:hypothetical protein UCRPC4_g02058 [Phaeomoniella chlamydospora]|uniref:Pheromone-regulated membrane protein n=1 Tax=Phaeomoniella chlamydospora TaxID=158046 RepID=A0A0G2GNY9_PHACM|nr:hypothetical protein UCRPC4_g02058 [Phaeomoniella chlamydospora]